MMSSQWGQEDMGGEQEWAEQFDPMLEGGYKVVYSRECPIEVREKQGKQFGKRDMLNVRLLALPLAEDYSDLKIELTSQSDIFMVMNQHIDQKKFARIRKQQSLNFNYQALLSMLIKLFNLCHKNPEKYSAVFYLTQVGSHTLTIIENIEYKSIEMIGLEIGNVGEELKKQYVSYRFSMMKAKSQRVQMKTKQMLGLVKLKNPNLLQTIAKRTQQNPTVMNLTSFMSQTRMTR